MCLLLGEKENHFEKRPLQCDPAICELKCKYFTADFSALHGIVATHAFSKSTVWEKGGGEFLYHVEAIKVGKIYTLQFTPTNMSYSIAEQHFKIETAT